MAYNFKSIADVEVVETPAETANVLIEENGVVKKAPKTAVGGEMADLVIRVDDLPIIFSTNAGRPTVTIESGSLESVANALAAGRAPVVKVKSFNNFDSNVITREGGVFDCATSQYGSMFTFTCAVGRAMIRIEMDNTDPEFLQFWFSQISLLSEVKVI